MNHTPAIDIWKGSNRVSNLWEELLASCVSPDPIVEKDPLPPVEPESPSPMGASEMAYPSAGPSLLEKAGFESLRLVRQALEILTAPPEQEVGTQPAVAEEWGEAALPGTTPGLTFIKVSSEPEPQPGSSINTRCIAYGLKIPRRPLHKRPIYLRLFFCLRHLFTRGSESPAPVTPYSTGK